MDQLSSELLLQTFKELDSKEMVRIMRVCSRWFEIIGSNKSLWRSLVLSENVNDIHQSRSILELFDRKSQSSLEEVDMKLDLNEKKARYFVEVLKRSKETLRILLLWVNDYYCRNSLSEASLSFPHLVDCRIINSLGTQQVRIKARDQAPRKWKCSPSLKVLCMDQIGFLGHSTHLLANLSSLKLGLLLTSKEWRDILEIPSRSLKHLDIIIDSMEDDVLPPPLDFPQLQILDIMFAGLPFPSWIKIPSSSTLISGGGALSELPSVSAIWTRPRVATEFKDLSGTCPVLSNLRVQVDDPLLRKEKRGNLLLEMLRQRRENVRNHLQVDGIEMMPLKTLTIRFRDYEPDEISQMQSLVEEVIDLATVPAFIELEV